MDYRKMMVWSCGDEKASLPKTNLILSIIMFVLLCGFDALMFSYDIISGVASLIIISLYLIILFHGFISTYKNIKLNKLIPLYLYDIEKFSELDVITKDKFVIFSDEDGAVLAKTQYKNESEYFCEGFKHFHQFEEYYNKYNI